MGNTATNGHGQQLPSKPIPTAKQIQSFYEKDREIKNLEKKIHNYQLKYPEVLTFSLNPNVSSVRLRYNSMLDKLDKLKEHHKNLPIIFEFGKAKRRSNSRKRKSKHKR